MKLPNVSWPIESENDRGGVEFGGVSAVMWVGAGLLSAQYIQRLSGLREHAGNDGKARPNRPGGTLPGGRRP
jgi:hypothetical protein